MSFTNLPLLRVVGIIFGSIAFVVGVLGLRLGAESAYWPSLPGKIITSEAIGMGNHQSARIVAEFRSGLYFYHCGSVIAGRDNLPTDVKAFPVGADVQVYHDPDDVTRCVLEPGISWASVYFVLIGLACGVAALWAHRGMKSGRADGQAVADRG